MKKRFMSCLVVIMVVVLAVTGCTRNNDSSGTSGSASEKGFSFDENVRIIVPYNAGGGVDVAVRALLEAGLRSALGGSVSVENIGGGNTLIGAQNVLSSDADGYTVFVNTCAAFLAAPQMYGNPYSLDDWEYITTLGVTDLMVAAGPSAPAKTVDELISYGSSHPEGVTVGCAGYGDISALAAYITLDSMGVACQLIPYDGAAESTAACLGGHVQYVCATANTIQSHCEEGTLVALYETGTLEENLLDVPSMISLGHEEAATPYYRIVAVKKGTPQEAVDALRSAFKSVLENPESLEKLEASGQIIQDVVNDPAELRELLERDYEAYGEMVESLNLQG